MVMALGSHPRCAVDVAGMRLVNPTQASVDSRALMTDPHRCGFVALVGRPNVGKSTLLNALLGEKLAAVSPRPQTTRNRIPGIVTLPGAQIVFVDTPGLHEGRGALNKYMNEVAREAYGGADVILMLAEAGATADGRVSISRAEQEILKDLEKTGRPVFLGLNKIDRMSKPLLLPILEAWGKQHDFKALVPISALNGDGVERLRDVLATALPEGPPLHDAEALTDLPERFIASEFIRERLFHALDREVPYAVAVSITTWTERVTDGLVQIAATIHVERESHKGIVIGKGGQRLKQIGIESRQAIEALLATQIHLELFVRVEPRWTETVDGLRKLGYQ